MDEIPGLMVSHLRHTFSEHFVLFSTPSIPRKSSIEAKMMRYGSLWYGICCIDQLPSANVHNIEMGQDRNERNYSYEYAILAGCCRGVSAACLVRMSGAR